MGIRSYPPQFLHLLKEVMESERGHHEPGLRHYPSSASIRTRDGVVGACLRQQYYRATNEPETDARDFSSRLQALFGQSIHEGLLKKFGESKKIKIIPENANRVLVDPLTKEISFRVDGLVNFRGEWGGLEIKTVQSFGLSRMVKEGGAKESDVLQVVSYFGTNPELRWFSLLYFGRDTAFAAEYHIYRDENDSLVLEGKYPESQARKIDHLNFSGIVQRWKELEDHVERKELPSRDYKAVLGKEGQVVDKRTKNGVDYKTDWRCSYCSFKTKCWSSEGAFEDSRKIG